MRYLGGVSAVGDLFSSFLNIVPDWFSRPRSGELVEDFLDTPPGLLKSMGEQVVKLPTPQPYCTTIQTALERALQAWQANPEVESNSLVVLGRPVEDIAPILKTSLQQGFSDCEVQFFLGGYQHPADPLAVPQHLQRELEADHGNLNEGREITAPVTQTDLDSHVPTIMVVSSLEQCFLRCIQGWEGIEYLQTLSTHDTSRFWVFGCNHWAWAFLERVCQVSAYLEEAVALPNLSGADLQDWLKPLMETELATPGGPGVQVTSVGDGYWNSLANVSNGIGSTALQM